MNQITYHCLSGQRIRQNQDCNNHTVLIEKKETDNVDESGVHGVDSFTQEIWNTDVDRLKSCAKDWAYYPNLIRFKMVDRT